MYLPIETQPSCALAWLAATKILSAQGREANNVIIDVADPVSESETDSAIRAEVDTLLRSNGRMPVKTVANTIFPTSLYHRHGSPAFYEAYLKKVFPRISNRQNDWGRYFERMISFPLQKKGESINPLRDLVGKMRDHVQGDRCFKNVYEMTIYDPIRDAGPVMNRQCLSFLSFKVAEHPRRQLLLTAIYRNHYYIRRLLGNLIGLGYLMEFVANEVGMAVGSLTVVSTHAEVDNAAPRDDVRKLIEKCAALAHAVA